MQQSGGPGSTVTANPGGTWNLTNISGTVSLLTGASTAAKQRACRARDGYRTALPVSNGHGLGRPVGVGDDDGHYAALPTALLCAPAAIGQLNVSGNVPVSTLDTAPASQSITALNGTAQVALVGQGGAA